MHGIIKQTFIAIYRFTNNVIANISIIEHLELLDIVSQIPLEIHGFLGQISKLFLAIMVVLDGYSDARSYKIKRLCYFVSRDVAFPIQTLLGKVESE